VTAALAGGGRSLRDRHRRLRRTPIAVAAAVLAGSIVLVGLGLRGGTESPATRDEQRAALAAYLDRIEPLGKTGGRVVQLGLKSGLDDLAHQRAAAATLRRRAAGWIRELENVRDAFAAAAADAPTFVADAARLYRQALGQYVETARTFVTATLATGPARDHLITRTASLGEAADGVYDRARAMVDRERTRLGLEG
jgi:hypothetical protein